MVVTAAVVMEIFLTQVLIRQCLLAAATVNLSSSFYGADTIVRLHFPDGKMAE